VRVVEKNLVIEDIFNLHLHPWLNTVLADGSREYRKSRGKV
jgi:hypothetical protein